MTTNMNTGREKEILTRLGLKEKEAHLYLAALNLGETSMSELAQKAGLKRSGAYLVFKVLQQKGLMGNFRTKSGLRFVATKPEVLKEKLEKQLSELDFVMPSLKALVKKPDQPKITFYEGKEGYITAIEDALRTPNITLRHIGSLTELHRIIGEKLDLNYYLPKRLKKNIFLRALYFKKDAEMIATRNQQQELREVRLLPESYHHKTSTAIYGNKVTMVSAKTELVVMSIESAEIAAAESAKFDLIWNLMPAM